MLETLEGRWQDGLRSNFVSRRFRDGGGTVCVPTFLRRLRDGGGAMAGRWRDGGGTVCVPTFFATLVGRWQDGFAFGIRACMRVKLYYLVMLYYILYSCVCTVCEY